MLAKFYDSSIRISGAKMGPAGLTLISKGVFGFYLR